MSQSENFAARWSRLKRRSEREPAVDPVELPADPAGADAVVSDASSQPVFDPATLPPIDSITIGKDIRAFLQSGVPAELTRAALRRAWTSDPSIRDFIGIAENQWNFNDPASIPGFGLFGPGEDVSVLVADALGALDNAAERAAKLSNLVDQAGSAVAYPQAGESVDAPTETLSAAAVEPAAEEKTADDEAVREEPAQARSPAESNRRTHGGALPQ
ncbi:MAG: DUF3306 domain-containing protein [Methylocella sp.]